MKRILYLHAERGEGGAGGSLLGLIRALSADQVRPVVALPGQGTFSARLADANIPFELVNFNRFAYHEERYASRRELYRSSLYWHLLELKALGQLIVELPSQYRTLKKLIEKLAPDIIHINSIVLLAAGLVARRFWRIPVVWHVRDILADNWLGRWAGKLIPRHADVVIAISKAVAAKLDTSRGNVQVIYNGIDPKRFDAHSSEADIRKTWGIPPTAPCVGFVGRLFRAKGIFDLVEAAPLILTRAPDTHFLILGAGNETPAKRAGSAQTSPTSPGAAPGGDDELRARIGELGLTSRFHLTGQQSNVQDFLAVMDVAAFPSWSEGFGLVVAEAMFMQKAVVTTNVTALPELVTHEETGLLVEPRNPRQLAEACVRFIEDRELALSCGRNAAQRARQFFTADREAQEIMHVYETLQRRIK